MKRISITVALVSVAISVASAGAVITVYKNGFSSRGEFGALKKLAGGGKCKKSWRNKDSLGAAVRGGKRDCALRTPVEGDSKQPDQFIEVEAKVTEDTNKKIRESVYVGVALRANRKENYELRVFPKTRNWQLLKSGEVLENGREKKRINGFAEKNELFLMVKGDRITAKVNNKELASLRDQNQEEVGGKKTVLTWGNRENSKKDGKAFFDKLKAGVPDL